MSSYHPAPLASTPRLKIAQLACAFLLATIPNGNAAKSVRQFLADGFDFPVGKPDGFGYYKARGFWPNGHLGEDWNGRGGGNSDLGDPVYAIGHGVVVFSTDHRMGWGNVVIIRHAYRASNGRVRYIDSLYGHLDKRLVNLHDRIKRGQQIGTIGTNRGMYLAHLHFEIRKNLNVGMNRKDFGRDYSNYHSPTTFIRENRKLRTGFRKYSLPVDTFKGQGKPLQTTQIKTVIPVDKTPPPQAQPSIAGLPAARRVPAEVREVLKDYAPAEPEDTRSFWERIKGRLSTRDKGSLSGKRKR